MGRYYDGRVIDLQKQTFLVSWSDGAVETEDLIRILQTVPGEAEAAQQIIDLALERGSRDNVTALVMRFQAEP